MALNPIAYTENVLKSFLRYQFTAYAFTDQRLRKQMRRLLSLDETRSSPLLKGPYVSLSRPFRQGASVESLIGEGLLHPHLRERIAPEISHLYSHQEKAIRAIAAGRTTLVSTGTGSGKTECFLYPIVSHCLKLRDQGAPPGISAVIIYPMNALAEDQLMRLRLLLAGTQIPFGLYVGKTPEREAEVAGVRLPAGSSRADYEARLAQAQQEGSGETVYPPEELCSRERMRSAGQQPRILLTNVKQLELLLTRAQDVDLFADARLDFLAFDEAHTFTGALGAETACLTRRLRSFCGRGPEQTACVATSATIVDEQTPDAARLFASRFFGVSMESVAPIGEDYEEEAWSLQRHLPPAPSDNPAELLNRCVQAVEDEGPAGGEVRSVYQALAGQTLSDGPWPGALRQALSENELVCRLNDELAVPRPLADLPPVLEQAVNRPVSEAEILAWLTLGAAARHEGRPLLRPVTHAFVRGIGGAVVTFPADADGPRLWLAAEDEASPQEGEVDDGSASAHAHFPITTCNTCGQHYYISFLKDFSYERNQPGGGEMGTTGTYWLPQAESLGGKRAVLIDRLIADDDDEEVPSARTTLLYFCRHCGCAHLDDEGPCQSCGHPDARMALSAIRQNRKNPGMLSSCLSCGSNGRLVGGHYREPARPVRATNVADVHVLAQDMVHRAERPRLLVFCDNRQDAAFQAGWMKDHARRFRLRALMAEGLHAGSRSVGDLSAWLVDQLEADVALSVALIPEVWQVARREGPGGRHEEERRKYLRIQVLRELTLSSRQTLGLEPWGRMKVDYDGLDESLPWIQDQAHGLGLSAQRLRDGVASVLDYLRRKRVLHDPEYGVFTRYWMDGNKEIQQGYLPNFRSPNATKLRRDSTDKPEWVTQWLSDAGDTTLRQIARKWGAASDAVADLLESLFGLLVERGLLTPVQLKGSQGKPLPNVSGVYQVNADRLRLNPNRGVYRCASCRRTSVRSTPNDRCPAWRCDGELQWVQEDEDNYDLRVLDGAYAMLRPEEHTAMVPPDQRERLENLFRGSSDAVNCFVCTPTLELGIDIGQLDAVLMRNVPPLPANYWQRAGRAGRRHRMAVDVTYCRPASHDRAYFADPLKLLAGRIDPPAFNLRNQLMVAKHVHATVLTQLQHYARDASRPEAEREVVRSALSQCLPRRVAPYLFDGGKLRSAPFDFGPLRTALAIVGPELAAAVEDVFRQGWPQSDGDVVAPAELHSHLEAFSDELELVVARLRRRLNWAMEQIRRLNVRREEEGTLSPLDETLFRRCDRLVKRLKGAARLSRGEAEGHDDFNTFNVLAAEGFLPGYGLEIGSIMGWAEIPFWQTGAMNFVLPRPPATALREYVPGNLIYANGHRFVARRFHRDLSEDQAELPTYEVSPERQAVRPAAESAMAMLAGQRLRAMSVCDADLIHSSQISDEEELRFQLGVAVYGLELGQHSGGSELRWGSQPLHLRRGVRLRLVNVGASRSIEGEQRYGFPVCTVCGHSVSPLSSERQREDFADSHTERCGQSPEAIGFFADVTADALSLNGCESAEAAYSVLEALRFGATQVLDMHTEDLQILVIGHVDRDDVDGLLWDPMPGGSGLLNRICERFDDVVRAAKVLVAHCPAACPHSCIDCLQTFRNAYYHRYLNRMLAAEHLENWGEALAFGHDIPPLQPTETPTLNAVPTNDAEAKLRHLLLAAGFNEGTRNEQIRLDRVLGSTTPDVIYRAEDDGADEGLCIYLDGLSQHLHGDPERAATDRAIRDALRNNGYEVIEISAVDLDDVGAMTRHFRRLAGYLGDRDLRTRLRGDQSWFSA